MFVGSPIPVPIAFAGDVPAAFAGIRYELEGADAAPLQQLQPADLGLRLLSSPGVLEGLRAVPLPTGGVMIDLEGIFMDFARVTLDRDGRPRVECATLHDPRHVAPARPRAELE